MTQGIVAGKVAIVPGAGRGIAALMAREDARVVVCDIGAGLDGQGADQIFGVRNNEIFLFNQPRRIRSIHRSDGWTPAKIEQQLKGALGPSFTPLERSGDVFSWDRV
jgi:hypothetical protein